MFSSKITTTCLMGVLVFAFFGLTKATGNALGPPIGAAEVATDDVGGGAASEPGMGVSARAASAPAEAHRPRVVPRRRGMS